MAGINYVTPEGLQRLKEDLAYLTTKGRSDISKAIGEAREKGDLSENAEYDAAKEAQGLLEARISKLQESIANSRLLDNVEQLDSSKALILSTVEVKNLKLNKVLTFTLVSENEADLKTGRLSVTSPIGKGLLGKSVGDIADVTTPAGTLQFEILAISRL
jgi:transcription elongation factor GreA